MPFIDTPMHPEYPCAHCILSSAVGTVLLAEIGTGPMPTLTTTSVTAKGAARSWTKIDDFMQEVANARIYDGVHYRNSYGSRHGHGQTDWRAGSGEVPAASQVEGACTPGVQEVAALRH